jgi:hypothetical protein
MRSTNLNPIFAGRRWNLQLSVTEKFLGLFISSILTTHREPAGKAERLLRVVIGRERMSDVHSQHGKNCLFEIVSIKFWARYNISVSNIPPPNCNNKGEQLVCNRVSELEKGGIA